MMLTRINQAPAPRPGFAPTAWTPGGTSTFFLARTIGWDGESVPVYVWFPPAGVVSRLSTPLPGLTPGIDTAGSSPWRPARTRRGSSP